MDTILTLIPVLAAIFGVAVYSPRTRILCYVLAVACIGAEIPAPMNVTAMIACVACLGAMILSEVLRAANLLQPVALQQ